MTAAADPRTVRELLEDAARVIKEMHALLPDDGKELGTAPSWWELGMWANGVRAGIANYLATLPPDDGSVAS